MRRIVLAVVLWVVGCGTVSADVRAVWAIGDGDKVDRDELTHPGRRGNAVWDGTAVRLFAARNEIVAFQVIVEADGDGIRALSVALPELRSGSDTIATARRPRTPATASIVRSSSSPSTTCT